MKLSLLSPQKLISSLWKLQILLCPMIVSAQEPDILIENVTDASSVKPEKLAREFYISWLKAKASLKILNSNVVQKLIPLLTNFDHAMLQDSLDYCSNATDCHVLISLFVEDKSEELVNAILSDSQLAELPDSAYQKALLSIKSSYENFSLDGLDTFNNYFRKTIEPLIYDSSFDISRFDTALKNYGWDHTDLIKIYSSSGILRYRLNQLKGTKSHG